jgi:hypothetical protein
LSIIRQRRGPANRLGFAVQLCYLRFLGIVLGVDESPLPPLLRLVAAQLKVPVESWDEYGLRDQTRCEHLVELQTVFGFKPFTMSHYRQAVHTLTELALQTDKGIVLASTLVENLRRQTIILPAINAIERACAEAITRANRRIHAALTDSLFVKKNKLSQYAYTKHVKVLPCFLIVESHNHEERLPRCPRCDCPCRMCKHDPVVRRLRQTSRQSIAAKSKRRYAPKLRRCSHCIT